MDVWMSQPEKQIIAIKTLPDISISKSNQTMKFDQLIQHNVRNIFLEKSCSNCYGETIARLLKSQNWVYLWINSLKCYTGYFYCLPS